MDALSFDWTLFRQGGPIMWPLLVLAVFGILIFIERVLYLHKGRISSDVFISGIVNLVEKGRLVEALTLCEETPGPVAAVVKAALFNNGKGEDKMRGAIQAAAIVQIPAMERRIGTLNAIARVAPVLGLLGTVLGMMGAFYGLGEAGAYANIGTVLEGFASALVTTAAGLLICALSMLAHHFLMGRVRALVSDMEYAGHEVMQSLLNGGREVSDEAKEEKK